MGIWVSAEDMREREWVKGGTQVVAMELLLSGLAAKLILVPSLAKLGQFLIGSSLAGAVIGGLLELNLGVPMVVFVAPLYGDGPDY